MGRHSLFRKSKPHFREFLAGTSFAFAALSLATSRTATAGAYFEAGASYATMSNGGSFFGQSAAQGSSTGFLGSFSFYSPITSERRFINLELGLQNRLFSGSNSGTSLAMLTDSVAARINISRFYIGAGYSPFAFVSSPGGGVSDLHVNGGAHAYFAEAGLVWRIIPEFQIALTYSREYGSPPGGGGASPAPLTEYGLRFRFPLNPTENGGGGHSDFDGFRYPFGFMK